MAYDYAKYLRPGKLPHIWCAGCTYGIVLKSMIRAIDSLNYDKNDVVVTSGIGCCSRLPGYVDFNTLHTTHGRSIAFATGVKVANPKLKVIALGGDGDMTAIGGNHFIHACRRNIDITVFVFNNNIYGMTGAQYSPTTPKGAWATTAPYGMTENNFDITSLAIGAGASFVARTTAYHATHCEKMIKEALEHKGLSVVEIINACPTGFGRKNKFKTPTSMLLWMKDSAVNVEKAKNMSPEELAGKFTIGVLHKEEKPEYLETYDATVGLKK
ncbi:MAG: 2-oxoglutarate/2-oxoacid ferredoxin oxidoreductase subunit beta [Deferribacteres bacterium]|jgi:2-oxoglutarate ferredoxin oxidoreductase subunit beta|nr:2-oxoglutarate ferredoxin oxidoreductase, beta subunit [Deferribacteraceae bacterium]MDK2791432.1 2-oxoglutarate/2-oxoacid ferredoxin oxidoreductase subunit beta [Deferribacteres bacterium]